MTTVKPVLTALLLWLIIGCGDAGSAELYARERALPPDCRGQALTVAEARAVAGAALAGVPVVIAEEDRAIHNTRRDRVTGILRIVFVRGRITSLALAHELAHAAVFDAYANKAPPGEPSTEKAADVHGEEFIRAYKTFIAALISPQCAAAL